MRMFSFTCLTLSTVYLTTGLYNAALFKPAVQSSTYHTNYAYLGVDGNSDSNINHGHCQHTWGEVTPWWMVDLKGQFVVEQIKITNRGDIYATRLRDFILDIFVQNPTKTSKFPMITGEVCYNQSTPLGPSTYTFTCSVPIVGRFVRIVMMLSSSEFLHTCEMEVLVSRPLQVEPDYFRSQADTRLTVSSLAVLTVKDSPSCLWECLLRRSPSACTAFNWVTANNTNNCQLFSVNPILDWTSSLVSAPGTYFYIQSI